MSPLQPIHRLLAPIALTILCFCSTSKSEDFGILYEGVRYATPPPAVSEPILKGIRSVFAASGSSFAVQRDGGLWAWGSNGGTPHLGALGVVKVVSNANTIALLEDGHLITVLSPLRSEPRVEKLGTVGRRCVKIAKMRNPLCKAGRMAILPGRDEI